MKKYYVYYLIDPISKDVKYVGASSNPRSRYKQHITKLDKGKTEKRAWIEGLISKGLRPEIEIVETADNSVDAREMEQNHVTMNQDTILNIHNPAKGMKSFDRYPAKQ